MSKGVEKVYLGVMEIAAGLSLLGLYLLDAGRQPSPLPRALDVLVTFAGSEDGTGGYFDMRRVLAAKLPDGQYWTDDGPMTGEAIDAQWKCGASAHSPSAP